MIVDYSGHSDDACLALRISGASPIEVTHIGVTPDDFIPMPSSHEEARAMIAPFYPLIRDWVDVHSQDDDSWPAAIPGKLCFAPKR